MTPLELKTQLIELLKDEIGTYTDTVKNVYPAIWISGPLVPAEWTIQGLEVTLYDWYESLRITPLTSEKIEQRNLIISLVQFDINKSVMPAIEKIIRRFPKCQFTVTEATRDTYQQARISVYDPRFLGPDSSL